MNRFPWQQIILCHRMSGTLLWSLGYVYVEFLLGFTPFFLKRTSQKRQKALPLMTSFERWRNWGHVTNLRWPYILKCFLRCVLTLCQISRFYHERHNLAKFFHLSAGLSARVRPRRFPFPCSRKRFFPVFGISQAVSLEGMWIHIS